MSLQRSILGMLRLDILMALVIGCATCSTSWGISLGQLDDFNNTTETLDWGIGQGGSFPVDNAQGEGVSMMPGDNALLVDTETLFVARLLVINAEQWAGDWTSAAIERVSMDVRNPNAFPLSMRLGIAGPGGAQAQGMGDNYVTDAIVIPADDAWHSIVYDVAAADFTAVFGTDIDAALAGVTEMRMIHNANVDFRGDTVSGAFYLDNIRAIASSTSVEGDYNGDGVVDAADYALWRDALGQMGTDLPADGNGDMTVNFDDYNFWRERFDNSSGTGAATAVPEPASLLLAAAMLSIVALCRRFDLRGKIR